jgi:2-methylcitrate dehydratase PrpD
MSTAAPTTTTSATESFVAGLLESAKHPLPPSVTEATERTVLNVLATAVGAAHHPSVDIVLDVGTASRGSGNVPVPAREGRHHPLTAALAIGLAAHVDDFDDTHLATVVHPGAAMLGALWPLALERDLSTRFLPAFAVGVEAQLRLALAVSPWHYDDGWHITGTVGPVGAAVGAAVLLGLSLEQTLDAVGIAASSSLGIREAFGTMMKPFHPGKAAENGLLAALLAEQGVTGRRTVIEAPRGFASTLSPHGSDLSALTVDLGTVWEIERNTFKPYPCGIVSHPAIDAAVEASPQVGSSKDIASVRVRVHPLVPELTGNAQPRDGLQARFSTVHGVAAGLVDGRVGLAQYTDERVVDAEIARVRSTVVLLPDPACARDEATLDVTLGNGSTIRTHVDHARGSLARPLTTEELAAKVHDLIEPVLPGAAATVIDAVSRLRDPDGFAGIVAATMPRG